MSLLDARRRGRRSVPTASSISLASLSCWAPKGLEVLWLSTAGLVPVLFAPPEFMAFIDVPKVAVLRSLTGLMALLWVIEWALRPRQVRASTPARTRGPADGTEEMMDRRSAVALWRRFIGWTSEAPCRWVLVAAAFFLGANAVSMLLSPAFSISLWGNNPGRDGYGFYNTASYFILFTVIATRLRSDAQLWRLLGVIVAAATLVSAYGVAQQYGLDPFDQPTVGGGIKSSFGNSLFAGSFLATAVPVSLSLALVHGVRSRSLWVYAGWGAIIAIQLMAVVFTHARGPWLGLAFGAMVLLALVGVIYGRRIVTRTLVIVLVGALGLGLAVMLAPSLSGGPGQGERDALFDRVASISEEVTKGGFSGRFSIWKRSASLIVERPWFDPDHRGSILVRHLFGYGPELFVHALPLRWAADAREPLNASAHNRLIHLAVELGAVGIAAWVGLVAALLIGGGAALIRGRKSLDTRYSLIYAGLLASIVARVVEQMTGVARISDTALFWAVAGVLVALPWVIRSAGAPDTNRGHPREARAASRSTFPRTPWEQAWRWGLALALVAVGSVLIWEKNVSYARSAVLGSSAARAYHDENLLEGLRLMDRAIEIAPDVEFYYTGKARMMDSFATRDASDENEIAAEQYELSMRALEANPLSLTARTAAASSALRLANLGQEQMGSEAIERYKDLALRFPGVGEVYIQLASAYLVLGRPEEALRTLDGYQKASSKKPELPAESWYVRGLAHHQLGRTQRAVVFLETYLEVAPAGRYVEAVRQFLQ